MRLLYLESMPVAGSRQQEKIEVSPDVGTVVDKELKSIGENCILVIPANEKRAVQFVYGGKILSPETTAFIIEAVRATSDAKILSMLGMQPAPEAASSGRVRGPATMVSGGGASLTHERPKSPAVGVPRT